MMQNFAYWIQDLPWEAAGHAQESITANWTVLQWVSFLGSLLFAVTLLVLIVVAILRNSRYRAVGLVSEPELDTVRAEVAKVEARTTGEVMVVVLERSDRHPAAHWVAAMFMLFAGTVLLSAWLPWNHAAWLISLQAAMAALGFGLSFVLPDFQQRFISPARAQEMADEQAVQEFHRLMLRETKGRTGVLILVSLLERRVVVLADEGIHSKVEEGTWQGVQGAVLSQIRQGCLGQGLVDGVAAAGNVLAQHFPGDGGSEDLPNIVLVRRE